MERRRTSPTTPSATELPEFSQWLKSERLRRKEKQTVFALRLGVDVGTLSRWERGLHLPRLDHQARVQEVVGHPALPLTGVALEYGRCSTLEDVNRREFLREAAVSVAGMATLAGLPQLGIGRLGATDFERLDLAVRRAVRLERGSQYSAVRAVLPDLLAETERMTRQAAEGARQATLHLLSRVQAVSAWVAIKDDDTTSAECAAARALDVAREGGDTVLVGAALRCLGEVHMRAGRYALGCDLAVEAAEAIQRARLDREDALCVRGAGYLSAAMACARGGDGAGARELLEAAGACAARLGRDLADAAVFGPSNVTIHRVAVPMELGDSGGALRAAEDGILELPAGFEERMGRYQIDLARAYAARRRDDEAVRTLLQAEQAAAEEVRGHRLTRAVLSDLLSRERRGAIPELRRLAERCGIAS